MLSMISPVVFLCSLVAIAALWRSTHGPRGKDGHRRVGFVGWVLALVVAGAISGASRHATRHIASHIDHAAPTAESIHDEESWSHRHGDDADAPRPTPRMDDDDDGDDSRARGTDDSVGASAGSGVAIELRTLDRRIARNTRSRELLAVRLQQLREARDVPYEDAQDDPEIATALADLARLDSALARAREALEERTLELAAQPRE